MADPRRVLQNFVHGLTAAWAPFRKTRGGRFAEDTLLSAGAVVRGFRGEKISLRASALTYATLFSLVPLLTVTLMLVEAFRAEAFRKVLQGFIHEVLAPGIRDESEAYLDRYVTTASAAGTIGFFVLIFSAGSLLRNLDESLNEIWNVRRQRSIFLSILIYLGVLALGPPFVALSLAGTSLLSNYLTQAQLPLAANWYEIGWFVVSVAAFTALYKFAPNARVRFRSALSGGIVAGSGWDIAKHGYRGFAAQTMHYNPVYGALGALPLFLIWIYVSWLLVLFGARLAYAVQHASFRGGIVELGAHHRARELIASRVAQFAAAAQMGVHPAISCHDMARRLHVPEDTVVEIVESLVKAGLVIAGPRGEVTPARPANELTLADVSLAVGGAGKHLRNHLPAKTSEFQEVEQYFNSSDDAVLWRLRRVSWTSLVPDAAPKPVPSAATGNP